MSEHSKGCQGALLEHGWCCDKIKQEAAQRFEYKGHGLCRICGTFRVTWRCTWGETDSLGDLRYGAEVTLHFACDACLGRLCTMMHSLGLGLPLYVGKPD